MFKDKLPPEEVYIRNLKNRIIYVKSTNDFVLLCPESGYYNIMTGEMATGEIHILPTCSSPEYHFNSDGMFIIRGRGLYKNKTHETDKVMAWVTKYLENPAEITTVSLSFEYLNSLSTIMLVSLLKKIAEVFLQTKKLVINWYYEEDDEDMFERGEYISMTFNIPFTFIPADHISHQ